MGGWNPRTTGRGLAEVGFLAVVAVLVVVLLLAPAVMGAPGDSKGDHHGEAGTAYAADVDRDREPPAVADEPTARISDRTFESAQAAVDAAEPGETVVLEGRFGDGLTVNTTDVAVVAGDEGAVVDGGGEGHVVTVGADDVTLEGLWIRNSGEDLDHEDAGVFVDGDGTVVEDSYLSEITYGIWIDGVDDVTVANNYVEGREDVARVTDRGNGIHLWETEDTTIRNNEITTVRDGIYFSWAEHVTAAGNTMYEVRYGVHYMYSNDNRLVDNVAVDNDVGYALMVSDRLEIVDNVAVRNDGTSGHGILVRDIEDSDIRGNVLVENGNGMYVHNAQDNDLVENLVLGNEVGFHYTAGSEGQRVVGNSFIHNHEPVLTTTNSVVAWNDTDRGNYWSDATTVDLDGDDISDVRHRPAGVVEHVTTEHPQAAVFAESPAFDAVRLAESSFPVVTAPGVVDHRPLTEPHHDDWRTYARYR